MFEHIIQQDTIFVVAGPCAAESEEQLEATFAALMPEPAPTTMPPVQLLRCGVWKPRTRPGGFEGAGRQALEWIAALRRRHPLWRVAVEVATPEHVQQALHYGMDALWVGARTTANPFLMTEIAAALRGTAIPVMVKNPVTPDVRLWQGAVERLQHVGITDVALIHRGFCSRPSASEQLRNSPLWEVAMEMRRHMPDVPMLCDPSHMGGRRETLAPLSQTALNLDFDGLMVECHVAPHQALTDAEQQVTPQELFHLLQGLHYYHRHGSSQAVAPKELAILREKLNLVDGELLRLIQQRMQIAQDIADVKAACHIPVYQPKQWGSKLQQLTDEAAALQVDTLLVQKIFDLLHAASVHTQQQRQQSSTPPKQGK